MKRNPEGMRIVHEMPKEQPERWEVFHERWSIAFRELVEKLGARDGAEDNKLLEVLTDREKLPKRILFGRADVIGTGSVNAEIPLSPTKQKNMRLEHLNSTSSPRVALVALIATGCSFAPEKSNETSANSENALAAHQEKPQTPAETAYEDYLAHKSWVSGDPALSKGRYGAAVQPPIAPDESHRAEMPDGLKPEHAPTGYGMHQWKGFSEYNPVAVAWLALKNIGDKPCTVKVTRLELSYKMPDGSTVLGSSAINDAQRLGDGTKGTHWGEPLGALDAGSTFALPALTPDYVHPFGFPVRIPDDAEQVTATFSAEISEGCIVGGGIDTYSDTGEPRTTNGYTQNGSETDFIKEGLKMPWIDKSVPPTSPISYAIPHKNPSENPRNQLSKEEGLEE